MQQRSGRFLSILFLTAGFADPSLCADGGLPALSLDRLERVKVADVGAGGELRLEDGRTLVLAAVMPGSESMVAPLSDRLAALLRGEALAFDPDATRLDRYGRLQAQVLAPGGRWVQADLVSRGLALVVPVDQPLAVLEPLLALEDRARQARLGHWSDAPAAVLPTALARDGLGSFRIVTGRIRQASVVRGRTYLNFGDDWRTDFTAVIAPARRRAFAAAGRSAETLDGRRVRVRGWIEAFNGPMIDLHHPAQIELLGE